MKKHEILNNLIKLAKTSTGSDFTNNLVNFIYDKTESLEKEIKKLNQENKELKKEIKDKDFEIEFQDFLLEIQHDIIEALLDEGDK